MREVSTLFSLLVLLALTGCVPFIAVEDANREVAVAKAEQLRTYAKIYSERHDGEKLENLSDLAPFLEDDERAFVDPWGQPYQFIYMLDEGSQSERMVVWTVHPKSGEMLGAPRELVEHIARPK